MGVFYTGFVFTDTIHVSRCQSFFHFGAKVMSPECDTFTGKGFTRMSCLYCALLSFYFPCLPLCFIPSERGATSARVICTCGFSKSFHHSLFELSVAFVCMATCIYGSMK